MYTVVICRKNSEKFVRWFHRQKPIIRQLIFDSLRHFYEEQGCESCVQSMTLTPLAFFEELASWGVESFSLFPESLEVVYHFHPFNFWKGEKSSFIAQTARQRQFYNTCGL